MARTVTEIYNELIARKEATPELAGLTSTAKTAIWRLWLYIVAYVTALHEALWDAKAAELTELAKNTLVGTLNWYAQKCKEWQNGYQFELIDGKYQYATDDPDARLVKRVAISDIERGIMIKVANEDNDGNPIPLTAEQLANLQAYINQIKIVGTKIDMVSLNADKLLFDITIYYKGSYSVVKDNVISAIINYLKTLPFDGAVTRANLITAVNNVEGVEDIYVISLQHQYGSNPVANIDRIALPASGYWALDGGNQFGNVTNNTDGSVTINNGGNCSLKFKLYV